MFNKIKSNMKVSAFAKDLGIGEDHNLIKMVLDENFKECADIYFKLPNHIRNFFNSKVFSFNHTENKKTLLFLNDNNALWDGITKAVEHVKGKTFYKMAIAAYESGNIKRFMELDHELLIQTLPYDAVVRHISFDERETLKHLETYFKHMQYIPDNQVFMKVLKRPEWERVFESERKIDVSIRLAQFMSSKNIMNCSRLIYSLDNWEFERLAELAGKKNFDVYIYFIQYLCQDYNILPYYAEEDNLYKRMTHACLMPDVEEYKEFSLDICKLIEHKRKSYGRKMLEYLTFADFNPRLIKRLLYMTENGNLGFKNFENVDFLDFTCFVFGNKTAQETELSMHNIKMMNYDDKKILACAIIKKQKNFLNILRLESTEHANGVYRYLRSHPYQKDKYMNYNEFTEKQWQYLNKHEVLSDDMFSFYHVLPKRKLIFPEIIAVHDIIASDHMFNYKIMLIRYFFHVSEKNSVDLAKKILAELLSVSDISWDRAGKRLLEQHSNEKELELIFSFLCNKFEEHTISYWRDRLFSFKIPLSLVFRALIEEDLYPEFKKASTVFEARFIIENPDVCRNGFEQGISDFCNNDIYVERLKELLEKPERFYKTHKRSSDEFFLSGNAYIAMTYYDNLIRYDLDAQAAKFKLIITAAVCGKLDEVHFHKTDLENECRIALTEKIKKAWIKNMPFKASKKNWSCYEDTSFEGIMNMGMEPTTTCMSYENGTYMECLLSYFDSNKKIVYVKENDKIIGRAVIRLTKMNNNPGMKGTSLDFVDITKSSKTDKDIPVLFLELLYTPRQGADEAEIQNEVIRFVREKAHLAGIGVVVSSEYGVLRTSDEFERKIVGIYITRSKAGAQYLDSFGGMYNNGQSEYCADMSEDQYKKASCYVLK